MVVTIELVQVSCHRGCIYAIPKELHRQMLQQREQHAYISCPQGHTWNYAGEPQEQEIERLRLQLQAKDNELARQRDEKERLKKRIHRGLCPFCRRSFTNVARHMACKHKLIDVQGTKLLAATK